MAFPLTPSPVQPPLLSTTTSTFTRRSLLLSTAISPLPAITSSPPPPDTTITDRVFMDFSICANYFRSDRTVSDTLPSICTNSTPLGRLVIGLYGRLVPITVSNFRTMCTSSLSSYKNTLVHKIFPGQFFLAGRQGVREKGEVHPPLDLARNSETVDSRAFLLRHSRAGVVSLCLSENDDDVDVKLNPDYRNVQFLITTGPGPCPQLDNKNIVFGTILEGLDVVREIASIPTYQPRFRQFNDFAEFLGDERAQNARMIWNRPLKTVYISDCGELKFALVEPPMAVLQEVQSWQKLSAWTATPVTALQEVPSWQILSAWTELPPGARSRLRQSRISYKVSSISFIRWTIYLGLLRIYFEI